METKLFHKTKLRKLNVNWCSQRHKNVFRFNVPMNQVLRVDVMQTTSYFIQDLVVRR